jgi:N-acetylglucosaminyldiphosphoundecaprenol N-acetyl-beta-D-mannosaminyltransferase
MIDKGKRNVIGVGIDAVDYEAAVTRIIAGAKARRPMAVSALAVHGVMTGALDHEHRHRLNKLDLVVPDGQPVRWAMKWLYGVSLPDRVYGPELTLRVCAKAASEGLGIYLYGSKADVIERFSDNLKRQFPELIISGSQPSRFRTISSEEQTDTARKIAESGASIVLVGLGCPRQETWVFENRDLISMPTMAVGAAFDFHAGTVSQAPSWLQARGFEWLYRFVHEPRRLWKRYVYLNPLYLLLVAAQIIRLRTVALDDTVAPARPLRFG